MDHQPYWYKLIYYWVKERKRDGLTIPFILGAKKEISPTIEISVEDIDQLFSEILGYSNEENAITFFYCDNIGENVLGLINRANEQYYKGVPYLNEQTGKIAVLIGNGLQLGNNVKQITSNLKDKYRQAIDNKFFSLNHFVWEAFSQKDKEMIMAAL